MAYRQLLVLVEGNDDEKFFKTVVKPKLSTRYDFIRTWKYSPQPPKKTRNFLISIEAMSSEYFFLSDINNSPCITEKKEGIVTRYWDKIDIGNVIVVIREIESWYLAGLDDKSCKELGIKSVKKTDKVTKERFDSLIPRKFDSRIDFMVEILKRFSVEIAKQKNSSFDYFMTKLQLT